MDQVVVGEVGDAAAGILEVEETLGVAEVTSNISRVIQRTRTGRDSDQDSTGHSTGPTTMPRTNIKELDSQVILGRSNFNHQVINNRPDFPQAPM